MIYTSYFGKMKTLPEDIVPIAICEKPPVWYDGLRYKKLAPKYGFFMEWKKMVMNNDPKAEEYYNEHFQKEVIDTLYIGDVIRELFELSEGRDFAMLCFEKDGEFCHRHIVAEWFEKEGYRVTEWSGEKVQDTAKEEMEER